MHDKDHISQFDANGQRIIENKELKFYQAIIPVIILMGLLAYNIFFVEGQEWFGTYTNQIILLIGGLVAAVVGFIDNVSVGRMLKEVWENMKSVLDGKCNGRTTNGKPSAEFFLHCLL